MAEDWQQRDASIYPSRKPDPASNHTERGVIDAEQENQEAGKE